MSRRNLTATISSLLIWVLAAAPAYGQAGRISPRYVDEWADDRFWFVVVGGVVLGSFVSAFWLPRLTPSPHRNDNARALKRFALSLVASILILGGLLLLDLYLNRQFGRQTYGYSDVVTQVFLTRHTVIMLLVAAIAFILIGAVWTRLSGRFYRYMLIRW